MRNIKINDITIRDIFQNTELEYIDSRVFNKILGLYRDTNYESLEILGGSSFERVLESNFNLTPLEFISYIKNKIPSIPLQILIGARNLGGPEVYSKNIIKRFVKQSIKNGIDIFRVYDSLNDLENLKFTISTIVENGARCQGTIIYDDLQSIEFYLKISKELKKYGCSSICIKDVESTILPQRASKLFADLSNWIKIPKFFSASDLRGLQILNYFEACSNGCNGVDLSLLPSSYNNYSSTIFSYILSLKNTRISHELDYSKVVRLGEEIKKYIYPYIKQDLYSTKFILSDSNKNLLPKWLISSIYHQLQEIGETKEVDAVLEEVFNIKSEIGNPSLSTPVGQIIGSQAILNTVISDNRWEIFCDEIKKLIWGHFGKLPRKIDKKILAKLEDSTDEENNQPSMEVEDIYDQCKTELKDLSGKETDILSYCFFPEKTKKFLEDKKEGRKKSASEKSLYLTGTRSNGKRTGVDPMARLGNLDTEKLREITSMVESSNIEEIKLEVEGVKISINNPKYSAAAQTAAKEKTKHAKEERPSDIVEIKSPIVGTFYASSSTDSPVFVNVGDKVKEGDPLFIIEAMKLMNKICSEYDGEIIDILVSNEEAVEFNQVIMILKKEKK
jgi:oxaloacetate decarboxylase alpha subunit